MVVSCTTTLSASYGAKMVLPGTGVVLNNSVASFSSSGDNQPVGGRRTVSSMSPTLVPGGEQPVLVLGTPGGDTIPSTIRAGASARGRPWRVAQRSGRCATQSSWIFTRSSADRDRTRAATERAARADAPRPQAETRAELDGRRHEILHSRACRVGVRRPARVRLGPGRQADAPAPALNRRTPPRQRTFTPGRGARREPWKSSAFPIVG